MHDLGFKGLIFLLDLWSLLRFGRGVAASLQLGCECFDDRCLLGNLVSGTAYIVVNAVQRLF